MEIPVVLYVANIMDYFRGYFLYVAYQYYLTNDYEKFAMYYTLSYLLDAFDGMVARALNQTSKLGLWLDMVLDRISSILLLHVGATLALKEFPGDQGVAIAAALYTCAFLVEFVAHGVVMYKSEIGGFHQKEMASESFIVRLYLDKKPIMFWSCVSFEAATIAFVLQYYTVSLLFWPGFIFRALANIVRLRDILNPPASATTKSNKTK